MDGDRNPHRLRDVFIVVEQDRVRAVVQWRDEYRIRTQALGGLSLLYRAGDTQGAHSGPDRHMSLGTSHGRFHDPPPFKPGQFMSLSQKPENGQAMDARLDLKVDEPGQALQIELSRRREWRRTYRVDALDRFHAQIPSVRAVFRLPICRPAVHMIRALRQAGTEGADRMRQILREHFSCRCRFKQAFFRPDHAIPYRGQIHAYQGSVPDDIFAAHHDAVDSRAVFAVNQLLVGIVVRNPIYMRQIDKYDTGFESGRTEGRQRVVYYI